MLIRTALTLLLAFCAAEDFTSFASLVDTMHNDLSDTARQAAAIGLLDFPEQGALDLIEEYAKTEQGTHVRKAVYEAIASAPAHKDNAQATLILSRVLAEDSSAEVRMAALQGLEARRDKRALNGLREAAEKDADPQIRKRAKKAYAALLAYRPPKIEEPPKPKKGKKPSQYNAVKGKDRCGGDNGWCQCSNGPITTKARCIPKADCLFRYENTYRHQGYTCTWDSISLEE